MNCSHEQFAAVWMQLEDALRGVGWAGNQAEVYLYLVQARHPALDGLKNGVPDEGSIFRDDYLRREQDAIRTIYGICMLFARQRNAMISWERRGEDDLQDEDYYCILNWNEFDEWVFDYGHRLHIMVEPNDDKTT